MQNRMKTHQLTREEAIVLLQRIPVAALATLGADGSPYNVPVHFAWLEGRLYIHGLAQGEKVENIRRNGAVCLTAWEMEGLLLPQGEEPCSVNTAYHSVVVTGKARLLEDEGEKRTALGSIVAKYTPQFDPAAMPPASVRGTGVIELVPTAITGKYYA